MQLSLFLEIGLGFWLISDVPISGWSGFPVFHISGLRVNLQPIEWKVYSRL